MRALLGEVEAARDLGISQDFDGQRLVEVGQLVDVLGAAVAAAEGPMVLEMRAFFKNQVSRKLPALAGGEEMAVWPRD